MSPGEKKPINVLFITPHYLPTIGGAEIAIQNLCEALNKKGAKPFLLTKSIGAAGTRPERRGNVDVFRYTTISVFRIINSFLTRFSRSLIPVQHIEAIFCAWKIIKKYDIDLIHVHYFTDTSLIGYLCKKILGKPMITHLVGDDIYDPIKPIQSNKWRYYSLILNSSSAVVVPSNFVKNVLSTRAKVKNCTIIPYGLDTQKFKPVSEVDKVQLRKKINVGDNDQLVVAVQSLWPRKKVEVLLQAARIVVDTLPNTRFIVVGDGSEKEKLRSIARQLGLEKNVVFTLRVSEADLINYLSVADVFSIHTLHEGFGVVYIEAMSMGLPIVTTRAAGNEDIIKDGENGFLVPPNDPRKLADKIISLLKDSESRQRMSTHNREAALEKFDLTNIAEKWAALYEKTLSC